MANMRSSDRSLSERPELGDADSDRALSAKGRRAPQVTSLILVALAVVLSIAAIGFLDGWANWVVLGAIVATTIGLIIALNTRMN